jgi:PTS system mannitol-specific IIA component
MAELAVPLLQLRAIRLDASAADKETAIRLCGALLVEIGAADARYVEAMVDREKSVSTYLGEGVAIPHGTLEGKDHVRRDALAVVRFADPIEWGDGPVTVCIAIAAVADRHVDILTQLAEVLMDPDQARELRETTDPDRILQLLQPEESLS